MFMKLSFWQILPWFPVFRINGHIMQNVMGTVRQNETQVYRYRCRGRGRCLAVCPELSWAWAWDQLNPCQVFICVQSMINIKYFDIVSKIYVCVLDETLIVFFNMRRNLKCSEALRCLKLYVDWTFSSVLN